MSSLPTIYDIERWYPERWSEIAGNHVMKAILQAFVKNQRPFNMFFTGESRSGKNRTVALGILAFFCLHRSQDLDPCHECNNCKALSNGQHSHWGLLNDLEGRDFNYLYWAANSITKDDLIVLEKSANNEARPILLHIDEADVLPRQMQTVLLTLLDVRKTVYAICTAVSVRAQPATVSRKKTKKRLTPKDPLATPFRLRFTIHHHTERPDRVEFIDWLHKRCEAWQIIPDSEDAVAYLADRTACRPGLALKVLGTSTLFGRKLTRPIVDYFNFDAPQ